MRRAEKEIKDRQLINWIIDNAQVCHLGLCLNQQPYVVPVSFGYDGAQLYVHTAAAGTKIDYWTQNPSVCFEMEHGIKILPNENQACSWGQSFYSVIGFGLIEEVIGAEQKTYALNQIMRHYSSRDWSFNSASLAQTRVWKISVEHISGKKSNP
jgi:uncharacterized protein